MLKRAKENYISIQHGFFRGIEGAHMTGINNDIFVYSAHIRYHILSGSRPHLGYRQSLFSLIKHCVLLSAISLRKIDYIEQMVLPEYLYSSWCHYSVQLSPTPSKAFCCSTCHSALTTPQPLICLPTHPKHTLPLNHDPSLLFATAAVHLPHPKSFRRCIILQHLART